MKVCAWITRGYMRDYTLVKVVVLDLPDGSSYRSVYTRVRAEVGWSGITCHPRQSDGLVSSQPESKAMRNYMLTIDTKGPGNETYLKDIQTVGRAILVNRAKRAKAFSGYVIRD